MRPDGPVKDLTEEQKTLARIAGVPADRPGLGAEYPKMVYKPGGGENPRHMHLSQPLLIGNGEYDQRTGSLAKGVECQTAFVDSPEDEEEAMADGWFLSPFADAQERELAKRAADRAKDDRIAELEAMLAEKKGTLKPVDAK